MSRFLCICCCVVLLLGSQPLAAWVHAAQNQAGAQAAPAATLAAPAVDPPPDPLPGGCTTVTPPGEPEALCCISGLVFREGVPLEGARVELTDQHGSTSVVTTSVVLGGEQRPYYRLNLSELNVQAGETITLRAHDDTHSSSPIAYTIRPGGQQVDLVLPVEQSTAPPIPTITHLSATNLAADDTLIAYGMGQASDGSSGLSYRWEVDDQRLLGTSAVLTATAQMLGPGSHQLTLIVQDAARRTAAISTRIYVASPASYPWAMLLYLAADYQDNESLLRAFNRELLALERMSDLAVRVAVLLDGPANGDTRRMLIYRNQGETRLTVATIADGERAMDQPGTLTDFLRWGQRTFPSEHYYLSIANHGQAAQGIAWDMTSASDQTAYLTVQEIGQALRAPDVAPIDIVHLDACSMNLLEVAYELRDYTQVLIASQYLGWSYFAYPGYQPGMNESTSPQDVARQIVGHYAQRAEGDRVPFTIAALDLQRLDPALSALDTLAVQLLPMVAPDGAQQGQIDQIWQQVQKFDSNADMRINEQDRYIDLVDWSRLLRDPAHNLPGVAEAAATLETALVGNYGLVLDSHTASAVLPGRYENIGMVELDQANGVSIFYGNNPRAAGFHRYIDGELFRFTSASRWPEFLAQAVDGPREPIEPEPPQPAPPLEPGPPPQPTPVLPTPTPVVPPSSPVNPPFLAAPYPAGTAPSALALADVNSDSVADLITVSYLDHRANLLLGKGDGSFQPTTSFPVMAYPSALATGDFDGDGQIDLAAASYSAQTVRLLRGGGTGVFTYTAQFQIATPSALQAGDFNGDQLLDLAVASAGEDTVTLLLGSATSGFTRAASYPVGQSPEALAAADLNGDDTLDLVVANTTQRSISVLLGNGNGGFGPATAYVVGRNPVALAIGQLSGDGAPDIAVAHTDQHTIGVLQGNGNGTFQPFTAYPTGQAPVALALGDLDGDLAADLAVAHQQDATVGLLLNQAGRLLQAGLHTVGAGPSALAAGDLNGDGQLDLVVASRTNGTLTVLLNQTPPSERLSAGGAHSCQVRSDGTLDCWGDNLFDQTNAPSGSFRQISAGYLHSCAIQSDRTLACWGDNAQGQANPPTGTFAYVDAGVTHSCGVRSDGTAVCWGDNGQGQASPPSGSFGSIGVGQLHSCGLRSDGTAVCWGDSHDGKTSPPSGRFRSLSVGTWHSCGLRSDGTAVCWGSSFSGQAQAPSGVFSQISAGFIHTCGLRPNGTVECWGDNSYGQAQPPSGSYAAISVGEQHSCARRSSGVVVCWGDNSYGQAPPEHAALSR